MHPVKLPQLISDAQGRAFELGAVRDKGAHVSVRGSTGETPCHHDVPSDAPRGTEVRVGGITGWQLSDRYYTQPANSDGVYSNARGEPGLLTEQPSVHWSAQEEITHKHTVIVPEILHMPCGL